VKGVTIAVKSRPSSAMIDRPLVGYCLIVSKYRLFNS
jgi:hypothetical protein